MGVAIPQIVTEDRAGGAQVIDGSLRFDSTKSHYLSRTPGSAGNRKTWTFSCWLKRNVLGTTQRLLSTANSGNTEGFYFEFTTSDTLSFYDYLDPTIFWQKTTTQVFRDINSWYHLLIAFDSTQSTSANRFKFYVNGVQVTTFSTSSDPSLNYDSYFNATRVHSICRNGNSNSSYIGGQLSNIYVLDGQALDPSYFGYTDPLTNTWRPKKYTGTFGGVAYLNLPLSSTPFTNISSTSITVTNNGTITTTSAGTNSFGITNAASFNGSSQWLTFSVNYNPSPPFTLDFYFRSNSTGNQEIFGGKTANPGGLKVYINSSGILVAEYGNSGSITDTNGAISTGTWYHVRVRHDGTNLYLYRNGTSGGSSAISAYTTTESLQIGRRNPVNDLYFNGLLGPIRYMNADAGVPPSGGLITTSGSLDNTTSANTNSFYLPFDGNSPIGQDQSGRSNNWTPVNFGGSNTLEKATGALPILNTDGGGKVARVGVRTDSNASSLVLALPLVGISSDFSATIKGSGSNKVITNSNAEASSVSSNFYGGSYYFTGRAVSADDYLSVPNSSDFQFGSGDFTIEFWANITQTSATGILFGIVQNTTLARRSVQIFEASGTLYYYYSTDGSNWSSAASLTHTTNAWNHIAMCRSGSTINCFLNGINVGSGNIGASSLYTNTADPTFIGGTGSTSGFTGYLQDIRVYKGLAKYTQNFIPASTDPDILPDTPSGVAYSSNVALVPSTDGAVAFDGSGDYLTIASNADFALGTGDFTIEFFYYPTKYDQYEPCIITNVTNGFYIGKVDTVFALRAFNVANLITTSTLPTLNSWTHIAVTRSATTARIFYNGVLMSSGTTSQDFLQGQLRIGDDGGGSELDGFLSNVHVVKGTALYTSNFTPPTAPITSVANTKLLCCKSNSSATAFDVSPGTITANGNATASNFNPFTVNINTQRGQESGYATWNPLAGDNAASPTPATFTNGNLTVSYNRQSSGAPWCPGTIAIPSFGKWYWEYVATASNPTPPATIYGICNIADSKKAIASVNKRGVYLYDGQKVTVDTYSSYTSAFAVGDTVGISVNMDSGVMGFYKNGIYLGNAFTDLVSSNIAWVPFLGMGGQNSGTTDANFGQKPFKFPPPAGFQPLALANTPRPSIVRPDQYVGIVTYTGNSAARSLSVGFKPDFVWIKKRGPIAGNHALFDVIRGTNKVLYSSLTNAEDTYTATLTSFNSTGFSLGSDDWGGVNVDTHSFVAWCWKAGGNSNTYNINDVGYATASAAGLTAGTITPTGASVNTKSGFSILTYTGTGSGSITLSHGLGKAPDMFLVKDRTFSGGRNWIVYHRSIGASSGVVLNSSSGQSGTDPNWWNSTSPTNSTISVGPYGNEAQNYVVYAWTEIPGFSKFGSYTGNGSADGPVVITGFRPRWILARCSAIVADWWIYDSVRGAFNINNAGLRANLANVETTDAQFDFLSNGFKVRTTGTDVNSNGNTIIYAAFAETPSFNLYGGQSNAR